MFLCLVGIFCKAQDFVDNPDYVYGIGVSFSERTADSLAILSLSRSLYIDVSNTSIYEAEETENSAKTHFFTRTSLSSGMRMRGVRKHVDLLPGGEYRVYYYINKPEYIESHLQEYFRYLDEADKYDSWGSDRHRVNLILGSLLYAYMELDDDILSAIYPKSDLYKVGVLDRIRYTQEHSGVLLSAYESLNGWVVHDINSTFLCGFEFVDKYGEWISPRYFEDCGFETCSVNDAYLSRVLLYGKKYRFTFEEKIGNRYVKIPAPEGLYVEREFVIRVPYF